MDRMIFVNLPVRDLGAARRFYTGVGFTVDERYSDDQCLCVFVSPSIYVMAMDRRRFAEFVTTPVVDAHRATQVLNCLSMASRQETEAFVAAALAHGGAEHAYPAALDGPVGPQGEDMYGAAVTDPDGHVWEVLYMAPA